MLTYAIKNTAIIVLSLKERTSNIVIDQLIFKVGSEPEELGSLGPLLVLLIHIFPS